MGGFNVEGMTDEISRKVATLEDTEEATSECVLTLACRMKTQRAQRFMLNSIMDVKEFDAICQNAQK